MVAFATANAVRNDGPQRFAARGAVRLMAQRVKERGKEKVKRPTGRAKERPSPPAATADARVRTLERECERLKKELEAARRRIAALEESRNLVAARIDGVIESLSGVVDRGD